MAGGDATDDEVGRGVAGAGGVLAGVEADGEGDGDGAAGFEAPLGARAEGAKRGGDDFSKAQRVPGAVGGDDGDGLAGVCVEHAEVEAGDGGAELLGGGVFV